MKSIKQTKKKMTEEKSRINISKNSLLHKSTEITGKLVKTNFFRTLEINQMLATTEEHLFKKILVRPTVAFYFFLLPFLSPQLCGSLKNKSLTSNDSCEIQQSVEGGREVGSPKSIISRKLLLFDLICRFLRKGPFQQLFYLS